MKPERLRILRAKYRVAQLELAVALGVHQSRISRAESGDARLSAGEEAALEAFFAARRGRQRREVPQNGHREVPQRPPQRWETKVRKLIKELVSLEKETPRG